MNELVDAWSRTTRLHTLGVVLDLHFPGVEACAAALHSVEAQEAMRRVRLAGHRFVVLAGRLLLEKSTCFTASLDDPAKLPEAAVAVAARLGAAGETNSLWLVLAEDELRHAVLAAIAAASGTEGSA